MNDLISRQQAIDALNMQAEEMSHWSERYQEQRRGILTAVNIIVDCPSAQPEIVLCKDCCWGREVCGNIECFADINEPSEYHGYEWFCPNGERRGE